MRPPSATPSSVWRSPPRKPPPTAGPTADPLGIGLIRAAVQAAVDAGELASDDVPTTAHLLLAALIEAGLVAASDPEPERALARLEPEIIRILEGLRRR